MRARPKLGGVLTAHNQPSCEVGLAVRGIVAAAHGAVNYEIVHLSIFGVQQRRSAMSAAIIDGVRAGDEHGRGADGGPVSGRFNEFEAFALLVKHDGLPEPRITALSSTGYRLEQLS
jgi:hypothetical protein